MKTLECTIKDPLGIHARTAAMLAREAGNHACRITLKANGDSAEVTDLIGVMGLGITCGQKIMMEFEGADEDRAFEQYQGLLGVD